MSSSPSSSHSQPPSPTFKVYDSFDDIENTFLSKERAERYKKNIIKHLHEKYCLLHINGYSCPSHSLSVCTM